MQRAVPPGCVRFLPESIERVAEMGRRCCGVLAGPTAARRVARRPVIPRPAGWHRFDHMRTVQRVKDPEDPWQSRGKFSRWTSVWGGEGSSNSGGMDGGKEIAARAEVWKKHSLLVEMMTAMMRP